MHRLRSGHLGYSRQQNRLNEDSVLKLSLPGWDTGQSTVHSISTWHMVIRSMRKSVKVWSEMPHERRYLSRDHK